MVNAPTEGPGRGRPPPTPPVLKWSPISEGAAFTLGFPTHFQDLPPHGGLSHGSWVPSPLPSCGSQDQARHMPQKLQEVPLGWVLAPVPPGTIQTGLLRAPLAWTDGPHCSQPVALGSHMSPLRRKEEVWPRNLQGPSEWSTCCPHTELCGAHH